MPNTPKASRRTNSTETRGSVPGSPVGLVVSLREVVELSESRKTMRDDLSAIKEILTGDRDPSRGLVVRVDRLEQQAQSNHWFVDKVLNAIIAALVAAGFTWFGPHR